MVRKSLLGRLFGKKDPQAADAKKKSQGQGMAATATATMTKKGPGLSPGSRISEKGPEALKNKDNRIQGEPVAVTVKDSKGEGGKPEKGKAIEPEIQSPVEKIDVIAKRMTAQEEVTVKISDGIKGLSNVLSNIDQKLEEQTQQSYELAKSVRVIPEVMKDLPESSRAGVELLQAISQVLENQSRATAQLSSRISGIPDLLNSLGDKMDRDAAERVEDRAAFKGSFQDSIKVMNESVGKLEKRQEEISKNQSEGTKKIVESFKNIQYEHQKQVRALIDKNKTTNMLMVFLIIVMVAGLGGVLTVLLW